MVVHQLNQTESIKSEHEISHSGHHVAGRRHVAACEGCGEEKRVERASKQRTWAIGTVASGSNDGVALGEVRGRQC